MTAHIIGVAGPSSSGKSELARQLAMRLPGTDIVSLDSYYRGMEEIPLEARKKVNFDHPDSLDWELLHEHLMAISEGRAFDEPVYSFADYARTATLRSAVAHRRAYMISTSAPCVPAPSGSSIPPRSTPTWWSREKSPLT